MALLEWRPDFSVGDPAVDHEHRELIGLVNAVGGAIQSGDSRTEIHTAYGDLLRAVSAHFAHEERQMRHAGYDQTEAHKDDHERLLDALRDLMDAEPDQHAAEHLARVLGDWFAGHFPSHDARLHNRLGPHDHD